MTGDDRVAISTHQLHGAVDAAKALLQQRGGSSTPRGGQRQNRTTSPARGGTKDNHQDAQRLHQNASAIVMERNAALDEASRLRRVLDNIGDVDQQVRDAVFEAVNKERHLHREALEQQRSESVRYSEGLRSENAKCQKSLQQKDKRIEALTIQLAAMASGTPSTDRVEKLEDQVAFLTAELLARDAIVDGKNQELKRLHAQGDKFEASIRTLEEALLEQRDREGELQRDIVRAQNDHRAQMESFQDTINSRDASLAQAELLELGLHRELEDKNQKLRAALEQLAATKEFGANVTSRLEEQLRSKEIEIVRDAQQKNERIASTRLCALEAFSRSAVVSTLKVAFKRWMWWVERVKSNNAVVTANNVFSSSLLNVRAELAMQEVAAECQNELVTKLGSRCHALLQVLRHAEQQQSQLQHVVHRAESHATMQRQDLQSMLNQARIDISTLSKRNDDLSAQIDDLRERLRVSEIDREKNLMLLESEKRAAEAARHASHQRAREMESMYESRLVDNSDSIRRERDVVERERASVAKLLETQESNEKLILSLRMDCTRAEQEVGHLKSTLSHITNAKEHADGLLSRNEAEWKNERAQLLEALDAHRTSTREALAQSAARDTAERLLRQRAEDGEATLRETEYQLRRSQEELATERERLAATQEALRQQLDAMTTLRSSSAYRRSNVSRGAHSPAPASVIVASHGPDIPSTQVLDGAQSTTGTAPQSGTPTSAIVVAHTQPCSPTSGPPPAIDQAELVVTGQDCAELQALVADAVEDGCGVPAAQTDGDDESDEDVLVLKASVESLSSQLRFLQEECNRWKLQAQQSSERANQSHFLLVDAEAAQKLVVRLEDQLKAADVTNSNLLHELEREQLRCTQLESEQVALHRQAATAHKQLQARFDEEITRERETNAVISSENAALLSHQSITNEQLERCKDSLRRAEQQLESLSSENALVARSASGCAKCVTLGTELADCRHELAAAQAASTSLRKDIVGHQRRNQQLEEELSEITSMSDEMKSAYMALTASSSQPHPAEPSVRRSPPPCSRCLVLEGQISGLTSESKRVSDELCDARQIISHRDAAYLHEGSIAASASSDLRVALDTAEVQALKAQMALKRMEESKLLLESRMQELTHELNSLHNAVAEERHGRQEAVERYASLVRKLSQFLELDVDLSSNASREDHSHVILLAVGNLQAAAAAGSGHQRHEAGGTCGAECSRSTSQTTLGPMTAAEVEHALQNLVNTHKREIRKLSDANTHLWAVCHASVDKAMIVGALDVLANAENTRTMLRVWSRWRLWREHRRRENVISSAHRTISRLQDQHGRLKGIASAAMERVKELERSVKSQR